MEITWRGGNLNWTRVVCTIVCISTTGLCQVTIAVWCAWLGMLNVGAVLFIIIQAIDSFPACKQAAS
jgi:hypothetical protein